MRVLILFLLLTAAALPASTGSDGFVPLDADRAVQFTPDGAWCWFQDPRAVCVSGARVRTYACWMTREGELQIGAFDHRTGGREVHTLRTDWDVDDHNTASILVLPDRRLMIFYARHNGTGLYCRKAREPESITAWGEEVAVTMSARVTYSHPVHLADENRLYVFWRGESWKPTFATSTDGVRWSPERVLVQEAGREGGDIRPYIKVTDDGRSSIHFAFTDGHPRDEKTNAIYYLRYAGGRFTRADGTVIGSMEALPLRHAHCDLVYDAKRTGVRSWVWDIALDGSGTPVIAYTRLPAETDHRYHVARWTGRAWSDEEVTPGGGWFPQTPAGEDEFESHYSGGITLHPLRPSIAYLSRPVAGRFQVQRWARNDGDGTWSCTGVLARAGLLNVRPVVPRGFSGPGDHVLWMHGSYVHYTRYRTSILMTVPPAASMALPDASVLQAGVRHWYTIREEDHVIAPEPGQERHPETAVAAIADNVVLFQRSNGGWPKNYDMRTRLSPHQARAVAASQSMRNTTFDNGATWSHCLYLADAYRYTGDVRYREAFGRGVDFILSAQNAQGGWPQFFPDSSGYRRYITFNDGAMTGILSLLLRIAREDPSLGIVDTVRAPLAAAAVRRGVACILRAQVHQDGVPAAWCQQHDDRDLRPRPARAFEPAALAGDESAEIVRFLMDLDDPGPDVIAAVDGAVAWFRRTAIAGIRVEVITSEGPDGRRVIEDRVLVRDPSAPPLWARYRDLATNAPLFSDRDGRIVRTMAEVGKERRAGYRWYSDEPQRVLDRYATWRYRVTGRANP